MRILMCSWEFPPYMVGGLGTHVYNLTTNIVKKGVKVILLTFKSPGSRDFESINGIKVYRFDYLTTLSHRGIIADYITENDFYTLNVLENIYNILDKEGKPDLIHVHDWMGATPGLILKNMLKLPLVTTLHITSKELSKIYTGGIYDYLSYVEKTLANKSSKVIACSKSMVKEIAENCGITKEKIKLIPNGITREVFQPKENLKDLNLKNKSGEKILLFVGRLVHEKGILLLVNAFPFILEKVPEARLIICGTGYLENIIKEKLYQLNIHHQVLMTGFLSQEKLVDYYTLADVAIFPSVYEPFGIVTLEAMSTRTPVIVSNVGGLSELVKDGVNGLKVRPGNIEDIVEKVILLLSNKEFAEELAEQGSNNILNGKSWSKIAEMTKELYQEILAGDEE